jgi:uncharacterized protein DUF4129
VGVGIRLTLLWLALGIAAILPIPAQAQTPSEPPAVHDSDLDLNAYRAELSRISEAVKNREDLRALRKSLPPSWRVQTRGERYEVSTKEISEALTEIEFQPKKSKKAAAQLESRLSALQQAAAGLETDKDARPSGAAKGKLNKILSRTEFQQAKGPSELELLRARINRWVFEQVIRLLRLLHISERTGNYFAWGVIFLAIVALFYAVYRWLSASAGNVAFKAETEPMTSDARHWLQEALKAAERGDFREAIHCAYWASVARLEDIRMLSRDRARTPRESLRLLEQHPHEQGFLRTVTQSFELIWYGYRPASPADWAVTKEQLEKMGCLQASIAPTAQS